MSQRTAAAIEPAGAHDVFASTRGNYERFAFLLIRVGHVPDLTLGHLDFRVLLFLLGQKPGHYAAHHRTIADACNSNPTSIKQALKRLRTAGLVLWELVPPHHRLPSGRFTRTNVNRYWVHLPQLAAMLDAPIRGSKSVPSTRPDPTPSYGTEILTELPTPPTPLPSAKPPSELPPLEEEAFLPIKVGSEILPIRESWEKLGLGTLDGRSVRALENRRAEGATLEQLEAAVVGAGANDWIRRRAKVPFAVVFASLASLERFAHEGRKILDAREFEAQREAEEKRKDLEWRAHQRASLKAEAPPTTEELSKSLPERRPIPPPFQPLTAAEFEKRRAEQRALAEAWIRDEGGTEGT